MDVFLLPLGADRYELYCEVPDEPVDVEVGAPKGFIGRAMHRFREMLAEAERERRHGRPLPERVGLLTRLQARTMRWAAESIAEQRLLWHLRRQTSAALLYPDDIPERQATDVLRKQLRRDFERHRFWLIVDSLLFVGSGLLAILPGPNFVAYYFLFRLIGHYFSLRGARQGLNRIAWRTEPSGPLSTLRSAAKLDPEARSRHLEFVAVELRLEHLRTFFERTAVNV